MKLGIEDGREKLELLPDDWKELIQGNILPRWINYLSDKRK